MPSNSNVVLFQASHACAGSGWEEEPRPNRYIIIISLYLSQRYCKNPPSGVQPCGRMRVSSESQFQSTRLKISCASWFISEYSKYWRQVRIPQSRMEVSTEETSDCHNLSPVVMLAQW